MSQPDTHCLFCEALLAETPSKNVEGTLGIYCSQACWFDVEGPVNP